MSCLLAEHMPYKGKVRAARRTGIGEGVGARFQIVRSMLHSQPFPDPMLRLFLAFSSSCDCCAIIQLMMEGVNEGLVVVVGYHCNWYSILINLK